MTDTFGRIHPYTCAYCTGDGTGWRPSWPHREGYEHHMKTTHHGLVYEPPHTITAYVERECPNCGVMGGHTDLCVHHPDVQQRLRGDGWGE